MAELKPFETSLSEGVFTLTLNRPGKMNALTLDTCAQLTEIFRSCENDDAVRCLFLRANGRAFCAGRDLSDASPGESAETMLQASVNPMVQALYDCSKPTLSAVNGAAMGIGLGLALACDVVIGSELAQFSSPFARLGAALDSGGHYFLTRRIGAGRAYSMVYTSEIINGEQAFSIGLLDKLIASEVFDMASVQLAGKFARGSLASLAGQKKLLRQAFDLDLAGVLACEARLQGQLAETPEYAEGLAAFQERREPDFHSTAR